MYRSGINRHVVHLVRKRSPTWPGPSRETLYISTDFLYYAHKLSPDMMARIQVASPKIASSCTNLRLVKIQLLT